MPEREPPTIDTETLARVLRSGVAVWLVHASDHVDFNDAHIPGSLSSPPVNTLTRMGSDTLIVVYGEDENSEKARLVVCALNDRALKAVWYVGGLRAWAKAGHQVEPRGWPIDKPRS